MKMGKILMPVSNSYNPDPRVREEAKLLVDLGYKVTIFAWDRTCKFPDIEQDGVDILIKRIKIRSEYGTGLKQIKQMLLFWKFIFAEILSGDYNFVHCHDFDTLIPSFLASKYRGNKIIYDAHEVYADMISFHVPSTITRVIRFIENQLIKKVDCLITVGSKISNYYSAAPRVEVVGNYKPILDDSLVVELGNKVRDQLKIPQNALVIAYIGGFSRDRALKPLVDCIKELRNKDIYLILGGDGEQKQEILNGKIENIIYLGFVPNKEVQKYLSASDIVYYALNDNYPNNKYSTPNSLFNALSLGKAVLTNNVGEIAEIVSKYKVGVILDELNPQKILETFEELICNPTKLKQLKTNSKEVALKHFSLDTNKKVLNKIYTSI